VRLYLSEKLELRVFGDEVSYLSLNLKNSSDWFGVGVRGPGLKLFINFYELLFNDYNDLHKVNKLIRSINVKKF
jgi:hypothetical protein